MKYGETFYGYNTALTQTEVKLVKYSHRKEWPLITLPIFQISAQNIDCGYSLELPQQGGSNEYPQSMFLAEIKEKEK